ncbi:MAG: cysteine desulfurase, partial [Candidatus Aenigmarchaeota archaeon]|nr:cysteine desulfurase [Candidatus Aenigmarchaeota archaeon]
YLDHAASTPVDERVLEAMLPFMKEKYGNASSIHALGQEAKRALEDSRESIAKALGVNMNEIFFTSGGTESNNWTLKGIAFANKEKGKHIITSKIEHDCVLNSAKWLEKNGFEVTYLDVDKNGIVQTETLEAAIRKDTILVSIIHGNNEIGTIQDLNQLGKICKKNRVFFHTDACQSFAKVSLDIKNVDLVTINAHKIYGPKGVGALYIRKGVNIEEWQHGGGHEKGERSGTENIPGVVGFAKAAMFGIKEMDKEAKRQMQLRDYLIKNVLDIKDSWLNGHPEKRLPNNANFCFRFIEGESLVMKLDADGICASTGSACSTHSLEPSHVLMALGMKPEEAHGSLRLSLGKQTTKEEIDFVLEKLPKAVEALRKISPFR